MNGFRVFGLFSSAMLLLNGCILSDGREKAAADPAQSETTIHVEADQDISLTLYRNPSTRQTIIDFYSGITRSPEVAEMILRNADINEVSATLAFSLVFAESRFNPNAVNRNASSIDRGLFQLNSRSFPELSEAEFFDPEINTARGVAYLRYCLDVGRNPVTALAMYNAGRTRVTERGAPKVTLDYIAKILDFQRDLEEQIETTLFVKRTYLAKEDDPKAPRRLAYVLDKSRTVK